MTVPQILSFLRGQTSTSSSITDATLLDFVNIAYHTMENAIVTGVNEDYFYEYLTTNLVANQAEYTFEPSTSTSSGVKKVKSVELKWSSSDSYFYLLPKDDALAKGESIDRAQSYTTTGNGYFEIKDSSIFIYPKPASSVTNGLKMQTIVNLIDLLVTDVESAIFPNHTELRQHTHLIGLGAEYWLYRYKTMWDEAAKSKQEFDNEIAIMVKQLNDRYITAVTRNLPNGDYYK